MELPRTPSFRLDGRRALVTGAGRGIGLAAAVALASAGAEVTLCARTTDEISEAAEAIRTAGGRAVALTLDVTNPDVVRRALETRPADHILLNNAGTNRPCNFVDVSVADYDMIMRINLRATFFVGQAAARRMITEGVAGSIIQMSSQMAKVGAANRSVYCTSKAGLEGLTRAMAIDLAPHGIRVNTLCPTFIETPMTAPLFADATFLTSVLSKIKLGRLGTVEDVMGAVVFLASDAAALMTGSALMIDGGWTAD